jgi:hypothetical protein
MNENGIQPQYVTGPKIATIDSRKQRQPLPPGLIPMDFGGVMTSRKTYRVSATAIGALAVGSFAVGAFAIGALAIGRLAIGRLAVRKGSLASLEAAELNLGRVTVNELMVRDKALPAATGGPQLAEPFRREGI